MKAFSLIVKLALFHYYVFLQATKMITENALTASLNSNEEKKKNQVIFDKIRENIGTQLLKFK